MPISTHLSPPRLRYHADAYEFVFDALRYTQEMLKRCPEETDLEDGFDDESAHISGQELLAGIRVYALEQFGLMARIVFSTWGITRTEDFGRMVFELVEEGRMRKTDRDDISDFHEIYDFAEAFDRDYEPNTILPSLKRTPR
ncbi:MAG: hypothetical protein KDA93_26150 [Planctomycetaceae bacterium]|nr:hypothetical protein [Planctomycetaceae bacterium]